MAAWGGGCCAEFRAWGGSCTRTEGLLAAAQAVLLALLVLLAASLALHLLACAERTAPRATAAGAASTTPADHAPPTVRRNSSGSTRCTAAWDSADDAPRGDTPAPEAEYFPEYGAAGEPLALAQDPSDGELADERERGILLALVRIRPSGVTFGCTLTVLSDRWTLTAASCVEAVEEVDSLDAFVMVDNYGEARRGEAHPVTDVRVHPLYAAGGGEEVEGAGDRSHDLALLKAAAPLRRPAATLPTALDYYRFTIGEKLTVLGFGRFRSVERPGAARRARAAAVFALPLRQCPAPAPAPAPRHLRPLAEAGAGAGAGCGAAPLCAGVVWARGAPCGFCAGSPLLRARTLLGVAAGAGGCGAACEPARYANLARHRAWLRAALAD